jgi:hypothetical protein
MSIIADAYNNPAECGATRRMLAYGVIHVVFSDYPTIHLAGMDEKEGRSYAVQCKFQIEVAMSQLDIFMPASYENIMALMLGGAWAVEMCKPSITALMLNTAAGLCQVLGYHRYQTFKDDTEEERDDKIHIFWMIYIFDKTLSLRLGRPSFIQDWDISLPYFSDRKAATEIPDGKQLIKYWVKVPEERTRTAIELVNALNQAWYERGDARVTDISSTDQSSSAYFQQPAIKNSSPIETEQPSKVKRGLQGPFKADEFARSKHHQPAVRAH